MILGYAPPALGVHNNERNLKMKEYTSSFEAWNKRTNREQGSKPIKNKIMESVSVLIRRNPGINFDQLHILASEMHPGLRRKYMADVIGILFRNNTIYSENKLFYAEEK